MSRNNGGSAFPNKATGCGGSSLDSNGMTLRDYFAAKICAAIWSDNRVIERLGGNPANEGLTFGEVFARESYKQADAMLKERNK